MDIYGRTLAFRCILMVTGSQPQKEVITVSCLSIFGSQLQVQIFFVAGLVYGSGF